MRKVNFEKKNWVLSIETFPSLVPPMNVIMLQHLIIQFSLYYLSSGRLQKVKHKRKFQLLAVKVVAVAYKRWSLTRDSKFSNLTWKLLIFWKTGHGGDLVAYER